MLFICVSVCLFVWSVCRLKRVHKNAVFSKTKEIRTIVSIYDQQEVLHGLFKESILGSLR